MIELLLIVLTNTDFDHMNGRVLVERYGVTEFVTSDGYTKGMH